MLIAKVALISLQKPYNDEFIYIYQYIHIYQCTIGKALKVIGFLKCNIKTV